MILTTMMLFASFIIRQAAQPTPAATPPTAPTTTPRHLDAGLMRTEITAFDGKQFTLAGDKSRPTVILLWASWCGPCLSAVAESQKIEKEFGKSGVRVIGLAYETDRRGRRDARRWARTYGVRYQLGWLGEKMFDDLAVERRGILPQFLVIDGEGRVIKRFVGYGPFFPRLLRVAVEQNLKAQDSRQ